MNTPDGLCSCEGMCWDFILKEKWQTHGFESELKVPACLFWSGEQSSPFQSPSERGSLKILRSLMVLEGVTFEVVITAENSPLSDSRLTYKYKPKAQVFRINWSLAKHDSGISV